MPPVAPVRRTAARLAALLVAALALGVATAPVSPASAAAPAILLAAGHDDEGGTPALRAQLEAASKGWLDARTALNRSVQRQQQLATQLKTINAELEVRDAKVGEIAGVAYRTGRLGGAAALLGGGSPQGFLDRAATLQQVAAREDHALRELIDTRDRANRTQAALGAEIREQRKQVAVMAKRKDQAERALEVANTKATSTSGGSGVQGTSRADATPAPRNADGSWPPESCGVKDPTPANGCVTPRMLHALQQAKAAGFTRYVSCYRPSGSGEHPKGRACDFAAQKNGFGGVATGGDKTYGSNLAAYFIRNADPLAVLYVIWFKQIWLPSSGWKAYTSGNGDPSSDHTNHVHLSVY